MKEDVPVSEIKKNAEITQKEFNALSKTMGITPYILKQKKHVTYADATRIYYELSLPEELELKTATAYWLYPARNERFCYAKVDGYPGKHLIGLTRRYSGERLKNKKFQVEIVEDNNGTSFRHADFIKKHTLNG